MVDKFDFYSFEQQREKVCKLKSLELEYKLRIDAISKEGLEQVELGETIPRPDKDDMFELEKYTDDRNKVFKKLAQLKEDLYDTKAKEKDNSETLFLEKENYKKVIVDSFYSNYKILEQLVNNTRLSKEVNDKDVVTMKKFLHMWMSTFGQLELKEKTTLGDTELIFIDDTTKRQETLIKEFTQLIEEQTDKESVLLLDNIKYMLRNKAQNTVFLLDKIDVIDIFSIVGILIVCIILYVPGTLFLLGMLLYLSYPFDKNRNTNYSLLNENSLVTINSLPDRILDNVKINSFELSIFWVLLSSYLACSLFYV